MYSHESDFNPQPTTYPVFPTSGFHLQHTPLISCEWHLPDCVHVLVIHTDMFVYTSMPMFYMQKYVIADFFIDIDFGYDATGSMKWNFMLYITSQALCAWLVICCICCDSERINFTYTFHMIAPRTADTYRIWMTSIHYTDYIRTTHSKTKLSGPRLNIKDCLSRYGDSHVKDKTAGRTSYL